MLVHTVGDMSYETCILILSFFISGIWSTPLTCGSSDPDKLNADTFWTSGYQESGINKWEATARSMASNENLCLVIEGQQWSSASRGKISTRLGQALNMSEETNSTKLNALCEIVPDVKAPHCPPSFLLRGQMCYHLSKCSKTYADAVNYCAVSHGWNIGRLLSDVDCDKQKDIISLINNNNNNGNETGTVIENKGKCCPGENQITIHNPVTGTYSTAYSDCNRTNVEDRCNCSRCTSAPIPPLTCTGKSSTWKGAANFWTTGYKDSEGNNIWELTGNSMTNNDCPEWDSDFKEGSQWTPVNRGQLTVYSKKIKISEANSNAQLNAICEIAVNTSAPYCPQKFFLLGQSCYHVSTCSLNYADAVNYCNVTYENNTARLLSDMNCNKTAELKNILDNFTRGDKEFCGQCCPGEKSKTCILEGMHTTNLANCSEVGCDDCCKKEINECDSSPCLNGSTCTDLRNGYNCTCASPWAGSHCEEFDKCYQNTECKNGATCLHRDNDYICKCASGYTGKHCLFKILLKSKGCYKSRSYVIKWMAEAKRNNRNKQCKKFEYLTPSLCASNCEKVCMASAIALIGDYCCCYSTWGLVDWTKNKGVRTRNCNKKCTGNSSQRCGTRYNRHKYKSLYTTHLTTNNSCLCNNPCVNGTCKSEWIGRTYVATCECFKGFSGKYCDKPFKLVGCYSTSTPWIKPGLTNDSFCKWFPWNKTTPVQCSDFIGRCNKTFAMIGKYCCYGWSLAQLAHSNRSADLEDCKTCHKPRGEIDEHFCGSTNKNYMAVYSNYIDACGCHNPCKNNATCENSETANGEKSCICSDGWTGPNCTEDIDECSSNPCQHNGTCEATIPIPIDQYKCTCFPGFTGKTCDDINECKSNPCVNNGTCSDLPNKFTCTCPPRYTAVQCEDYDYCYGISCYNNGTCRNGPSYYNCTCFPGYTGRHCEIDINECTHDSNNVPRIHPINCHNGTCHNRIGKYECVCTPGYSLRHCEHDIDECESDPCQNNATCHNPAINMYSCQPCVPGYNGTNCETDIDECASNPCKNNATCVDNINHFQCNCSNGYDGTFCEHDIQECDSNPCQHNGTCTEPALGMFTCDCHEGTSGEHCENNFDECHSTPCVGPNSTCENHFGRYICVCIPEYTDVNCQLLTSLWLIMEQYKTSLNLEQLLKDIVTASSTIVDAVPFVVARMSDQSKRMNLSWNKRDVFENCMFENVPCNLKKDIQVWEEKAMGNCFTFNHENQSEHFKVIRTGAQYGFDVWLNIHQEEYVPWTDVAGFKIFIHNQSEQIFSESLSYYAPGGAHIYMALKYTEYKKLPKPYSDCITDKSSVKYYYNEGSEYTKEACIRSCLQEELRADCGCADPRYSQPPDLEQCPLEKRTCINDFLTTRGDPTQWPDCVCPVACKFGEYDVTITRSKYRAEATDCIRDKFPNETEFETCLKHAKLNKVRVTVYFENHEYLVYEEMPAVEFFEMLGNVGGQMGILAGISAISIVEILLALFRVVFIFITGRGGVVE